MPANATLSSGGQGGEAQMLQMLEGSDNWWWDKVGRQKCDQQDNNLFS